MKSYFILDCPKQQSIADSLYDYYTRLIANKKIEKFWNSLSRPEIQNYFSMPNLEIKDWFDQLGLRVRDMSFTIYNEEIQTRVHTDAPPVIAKINFPVLNTQDTYNVWYNKDGKEIDRIECLRPIVLRSDIPHTVDIGLSAKFPRLQFSFCFYKDPIHLLK
jgi:hypothetical protein